MSCACVYSRQLEWIVQELAGEVVATPEHKRKVEGGSLVPAKKARAESPRSPLGQGKSSHDEEVPAGKILHNFKEEKGGGAQPVLSCASMA